MKITFLKQATSAFTDFVTREWDTADKEHYGKRPDWKTNTHLLQATENEIVVGIVEMEIQLQVCTVKQFLIAKSYRRKGVGKFLMLKVEEFAKEQGSHKVYLITGKGWDAEDFYFSMGYKKAGELPEHYLRRDFVEYHKFI